MNYTDRISAEQLKEGFDWIGQPRVSNLDTAEADLAALHLEILERLAGTDPDDLATLTRGRVTCPVEHRAALRELIARPVALEPGMVLPWRLVGSFAGAKCWANHAPIKPMEKDDWLRHALEYGLMLGFLLTASRHVRTCGWRLHLVAPDEVAAISQASAAELLRIAVECPRWILGLVFAPPDAQEQDCARRIRDTELGFRRLAEAKLRTRSLLARVMR
jgi:hypothetical protein